MKGAPAIPVRRMHQLAALVTGKTSNCFHAGARPPCSLLRREEKRFPDVELYGIDASVPMLEQAQRALSDTPHIHLAQAELGAGRPTNLPFATVCFDLITCTNTLHYFSDPVATLRGWRERLVSMGQVVMEDYTLHSTPLPFNAFEWAIKLYDPQHVRLYTFLDIQ